MKWDVLNMKGDKVREIELPEEMCSEEVDGGILHAAVKAQLANARQGTHATKTRSTVSGSGKKPFRQKGTGNARQGCSRSPLMPGGATSHGPQPRSYHQKLNKKLRTKALRMAVADKVASKGLIIVDEFSFSNYRTKDVIAMLQAVKADGKSLLACDKKNDYLYRSARNVYGASVTEALNVSVVDILGHSNLIVSEAAIQALKNRLEKA